MTGPDIEQDHISKIIISPKICKYWTHLDRFKTGGNGTEVGPQVQGVELVTVYPGQGGQAHLEAYPEDDEQERWEEVSNPKLPYWHLAVALSLSGVITEQLHRAAPCQMDGGGEAEPGQAEEGGAEAPGAPPAELVGGDTGQELA